MMSSDKDLPINNLMLNQGKKIKKVETSFFEQCFPFLHFAYNLVIL